MEESLMILFQIGPETFILPFFLILVSFLFVRFVKFKNWFGESFQLAHLGWAAFILLALLATGIGLELVSTHLGLNDTEQVDHTIDVISTDPLTGVLLLMVSALGEELFFRGILQSLIGWVSIPIFALVHAGYHSVTQVIAALLGGIIFFLARMKSNSIYPGLIAHFLYNVIAVFFIHV